MLGLFWFMPIFLLKFENIGLTIGVVNKGRRVQIDNNQIFWIMEYFDDVK